MRKALCLYRNPVEQAFAIMKGVAVGSDEPALWAQDLGMRLTPRSARRLGHENGTYMLLAAEHDKLGLGRKNARPRPTARCAAGSASAPSTSAGPGRPRSA
jgi:hypothetical protein